MSTYDLIFQRAVRLLGVILGTGIATWETLADHAQHPWAYFASVTFLGLPAARAVEEALRLMSNSEQNESDAPDSEPKPKPRRRR